MTTATQTYTTKTAPIWDADEIDETVNDLIDPLEAAREAIVKYGHQTAEHTLTLLDQLKDAVHIMTVIEGLGHAGDPLLDRAVTDAVDALKAIIIKCGYIAEHDVIID